jgi:CheY-like chemotaxis protein
MMRPLRVLIVEDEFFIAMALEQAVEDFGHTVIGTAATEETAIRLASETQPDVVLLDIRLANGGDGIRVAHRIMPGRPVEVVFLTANTEPATQARALAVAPRAILDKPIEPDVLQGVLADIAQSRS